MASLPFIKTLSAIVFSPLYFNNAVGTHGSAESASDTSRLISDLYGVVSFFVDFVGCKTKNLLRAGIHTQSATLAVVGFKG
jgi:hypothetical protein